LRRPGTNVLDPAVDAKSLVFRLLEFVFFLLK
jgi:hypothetical protein